MAKFSAVLSNGVFIILVHTDDWTGLLAEIEKASLNGFRAYIPDFPEMILKEIASAPATASKEPQEHKKTGCNVHFEEDMRRDKTDPNSRYCGHKWTNGKWCGYKETNGKPVRFSGGLPVNTSQDELNF